MASVLIRAILRKICVDKMPRFYYNGVRWVNEDDIEGTLSELRNMYRDSQMTTVQWKQYKNSDGETWTFASPLMTAAIPPPPKIEPSLALYGSIIKLLKPIFPEGVVIAGGCLRDIRYGYAPKDIDIFVNLSDELSLELRMDEAYEALTDLKLGPAEMYNLFDKKQEGWVQDYVKGERNSADEMGDSCVGVYCLNFKNFSPEIQIIAKPLKEDVEWSGESIVATFDYNLVQQYIDSEDGEIKGSDEIIKQIADRALYLKKTGDKKTEERLHRFLARTNFEPSNKEELAFLNPSHPMNRINKSLLRSSEDGHLTDLGRRIQDVFTEDEVTQLILNPNGYGRQRHQQRILSPRFGRRRANFEYRNNEWYILD